MKNSFFKNKKIIFSLLAVIVATTGVFVFANYYKQDKPSQPSGEQSIYEQKDNKPTVEPQKVEFKIIDEVAEISEEELLSTATWETYEHPQYTAKYPSEWHIVEASNKDKKPNNYYVSFSTSPTGSAYDFDEDGNKTIYENWARVGFTIHEKSSSQTLEQWLEERVEFPGPGVDASVHNIRIGEKTFLGSYDFRKRSEKNAYFELGENNVLIVRVPSQAIRHPEAHKIYYTVLNSLQIQE